MSLKRLCAIGLSLAMCFSTSGMSVLADTVSQQPNGIFAAEEEEAEGSESELGEGEEFYDPDEDDDGSSGSYIPEEETSDSDIPESGDDEEFTDPDDGDDDGDESDLTDDDDEGLSEDEEDENYSDTSETDEGQYCENDEHDMDPTLIIEEEATYEDIAIAYIKCKKCDYKYYMSDDSDYWDPSYFASIQILHKDAGVITEDTAVSLTLSDYKDQEYGQYLSFTPEESGSYQISCDVTSGANPELSFSMNDLYLSTVSGSNIAYLNAGETYLVRVEGRGSYSVKVSKIQAKIALFDENGEFTDPDTYSLVADLSDHTYDGGQQEIEDLQIVSRDVNEEVQYNVSYENNVNVGTATCVITAYGNYSGTKTLTFKINKAETVFDAPAFDFIEGVDSGCKVVSSDFSSSDDDPDVANAVSSSDPDVLSVAYNDEDKCWAFEAKSAGKVTLTVTADATDNYEAYTGEFEVTVAAKEHQHSFTNAYTEPTCTENGYTTYTCDCGYSYIVVDEVTTLKDHEFEDYQVIEPTCTVDGYTQEKCLNCGFIQVKEDSEVDPLEHSWIYKESFPATENSRAYHVYTCENCNQIKKVEYGCFVGKHDYSITRVVEPSCTEEGYTLHICSVCGDEEQEDETPALGHTITDTVIPATESTLEYTVHTCSVCGYTEKEITGCYMTADGKNIHVADDDGYTELDADCEDAATRSYKCKYCGQVITEVTSPALGHDYQVTREASCEEDGLKTCTRCQQEEEIPAEHAWDYENKELIQDDPYTDPGFYRVTCKKCGQYDDEEPSVQVQKAGQANLTFTSGKAVKKVTLSNDEQLEYGYYYKFTAPETAVYQVKTSQQNLYASLTSDDLYLTNLGEAAQLTKGQVYYVKVTGFEAATDTFTLAKVTSFINIKDKKFTIKIADKNLVYQDGEEVEPSDVTVLNDSEILDSSNYKISYSNNTDAGTATIKVTGIGLYSGTIESTYQIAKMPATLASVSALSIKENQRQPLGWEDYLDTPLKLTTDNADVAKIIQKDDDYYLCGFSAGTAHITAVYEGDDNHEGASVSITVSVTETGHLHDYLIAGTGEEDPTYDTAKAASSEYDCEEGRTYHFTCSCGYTETWTDEAEAAEDGHDFPDEDFDDDGNYVGPDGYYQLITKPTYTSAGSYKLKCLECGAWTEESIDPLEAVSMEDLDIELSKTSFTCNGKAQKPSVSVWYEDELTNNKHYTLTFANNINAGKASVTISGILKAGYTGSVTRYFTMKPLITAKKTSITAGQSTNVYMKYGMKSVTSYKSSSTALATVSSKGVVKAKKAGIVTITVTGKNASGAVVTGTVKIKVLPKVTQLKSVKPAGSKKLAVTWAKNTTAGGYLIQYSTSSKFKSGVKTIVIKKNTITKYVIKKLKAKKKYYVRIRAINSSAKATMSAYSKVKSIKTK